MEPSFFSIRTDVWGRCQDPEAGPARTAQRVHQAQPDRVRRAVHDLRDRRQAAVRGPQEAGLRRLLQVSSLSELPGTREQTNIFCVFLCLQDVRRQQVVRAHEGRRTAAVREGLN